MKMVYITYRTPRGAVLTDAMTSVENFRRFRGDEDEILDVSPPFEADLSAPDSETVHRRRTLEEFIAGRR